MPNLQRKSDFDRKVDLDVSTDEKAYEAGYFPLSIILDWERGILEAGSGTKREAGSGTGPILLN